MMDGKTLRDKLVGSEDERAVSPVIGVILMVAITVILAAVIATLVMDFGDSTSAPVNAVVNEDVSNSDGEVQFTITDAGDAETLEVRGPTGQIDGGDVITLTTDASTGNVVTISDADGGSGGDDGNTFSDSAEGEFTVVAISGDDEQTVNTFEIDFDAP